MRIPELAFKLGVAGSIAFSAAALGTHELSQSPSSEMSDSDPGHGEFYPGYYTFPPLSRETNRTMAIFLENNRLVLEEPSTSFIVRGDENFPRIMKRYSIGIHDMHYTEASVYMPFRYSIAPGENIPSLPRNLFVGEVEDIRREYFFPFTNNSFLEGITLVDTGTAKMLFLRKDGELLQLTPDKQTIISANVKNTAVTGLDKQFFYIQYDTDVQIIPQDGSGVYNLSLDLNQTEDQAMDFRDMRIDEDGNPEIILADTITENKRLIIAGDGWIEHLPLPPEMGNNSLNNYEFFFSPSGEIINMQVTTNDSWHITSIVLQREQHGAWHSLTVDLPPEITYIDKLVPLDNGIGILRMNYEQNASGQWTVTPHLFVVPYP